MATRMLIVACLLAFSCSPADRTVDRDVADADRLDVGAGETSDGGVDAERECTHNDECLHLLDGMPPCLAAKCLAGHCMVDEKLDDMPCNDGNPCTTMDRCLAGECIPGENRCMCGQNWECGRFDEHKCGPFYVCQVSDAGIGLCVPDASSTVECDSAYDTDCLKNRCAPETGQCLLAPVDDGAVCDDGDACTLADQCQEGLCGGSLLLQCDDANPCTTDVCVPATGCSYAAVQGDCPWGECQDGECVCLADCGSRDCGPDGCGGVCGVCQSGLEQCNEYGYCVSRVVSVPEGEFLMGSNTGDGGDSDDCELLADLDLSCGLKHNSPQHPVYLDAFEVDAFETTNAQFLAFLNAVESKWGLDGDGTVLYVMPDPTSWGNSWANYGAIVILDDGSHPLGQNCSAKHEPYVGTPTDCSEYPVVTTWQGADAFCNWAGKRLCNEAEWERVCTGPEHRLWPWGNEWDRRHVAYANYSSALSPGEGAGWCTAQWLWPVDLCELFEFVFWKGPTKVGSYPLGATPDGAFDFMWNVPEWVMDVADKDFYDVSPYSNPVATEYPPDLEFVEGFEQRVIRGAGRVCSLRYLGTTSPPVGESETGTAGFRCCRDAE